MSSVSAYAYATNRPTSMIDPDGDMPGFLQDMVDGAEQTVNAGSNWVQERSERFQRSAASAARSMVAAAAPHVQDVANFAAGFADNATMGLSTMMLDQLGVGSYIDPCSGAFKGGQVAGMVVDVALMATGVGAAAGGAKLAANAAKLGKMFDGAGAAASVSRRTANAAGDTRSVNFPSCVNSFVAGTPVLMADGSRTPIEDIEVGDEVTATDPVTGKTSDEEVTALIQGEGEKVLVTVTTSDGLSITATGNHPFWEMTAATWTEASDLEIGDRLQSAAGAQMTVVSLFSRTVPAQKVYNLTVSDVHTYYAGAGDLLVHNSNACSTLKRNMAKAGQHLPAPDYQAHHIIPHGAKRAQEAQGIMEKYGLDINSADNGIYLPRNWDIPNPTGLSPHNETYTKVYYDMINDEMRMARSKEEAQAVIQGLRHKLMSGWTRHD